MNGLIFQTLQNKNNEHETKTTDEAFRALALKLAGSPWFDAVFAEMLQDQTILQRPYRDSMNRLQAGSFLLNDDAAEYDKSQMFVVVYL